MAKEVKIKTRGSVVDGLVVSDKGKNTVIVQRELTRFIPKYERYARSHSKIPAHNPDEMGAKTGDIVRIAECRKLSRTKAWIVTQILEKGGAGAQHVSSKK
jgi:small subunit ribosomal protein S17